MGRRLIVTLVRTAVVAFWYTITVLALAGSIVGLSLAVRTRLRGSWAVTGLVTGIMGLLGRLQRG